MLNKEVMVNDMTGKVKENASGIIAACYAYIAAKAWEDTVKETVAEIKRKVLAENEYYMDVALAEKRNQQPKRITDPRQDYMMAENDFLDFIKKCYPLEKEAGIANPDGYEYCADAPAREQRVAAEENLLDEFMKILPEGLDAETFKKARTHWKYRDRMIELALDMLKLEGVKEA